MNAREFINYLLASPDYAGQMVHVEHLPARAPAYQSPREPLPSALDAALAQVGIGRLYTHQAQAIDSVRDGRHTMVVTGTSSGKTLCYNLPVLEEILRQPLSRALYLFPTKALAQDQLRALTELTSSIQGTRIHVGAYDGDTPRGSRPALRRRAHIILSNPDMLHMAILPNHSSWEAFFRHLKYVVLDEAHVYRGIFGSHVACVLRRLRRICALYGASPQFILCSATIANPAEFAGWLLGDKVAVIDEDGAPRGAREFALWNPPFVDQAAGVRASVNSEATWLFVQLVTQGLRNITFTRARRVAELILLYAQDALRRQAPQLLDRISAYRGGYLPAERRAIEQRLFSGDLFGVTATNALELGIDVGHLDATVMVGYPGSIASTWQQAGRAGRGTREAVSILIGHDDPLDQFYMRHPEELFGRPHEHALMDPTNEHVLRAHLPCAAYESPLSAADATLFGDSLPGLLDELCTEGKLVKREGRWLYPSSDYPAQGINLRSSSETQYLIFDESAGSVLEEIDAATALYRVYPGAIYLHQAVSYLITRLDLARRVAVARPVEVAYYTQARETNEVQIVHSQAVRHTQATDVFFGEVRVVEQVIGFRRKQQFTDTVLSEEPLDLPSTMFETQALWFEVPPAIVAEIVHRGLDLAGALHAVEHACIGILPLFALCDRNDIGGLSTPAHPDTDRPQVFIYDGYPGGVGIARKGFELAQELWARTLQVVAECPCEEGCPSCIHSPKCGNNNEPLDKAGAVVLLQWLLGEGAPPWPGS
ncbi:MAG: DEAD/DEAH box helicase [Chloroflexi bacterium]|nr:DEAD/DEAH box helicase [Chloroflexota bacterium]